MHIGASGSFKDAIVSDHTEQRFNVVRIPSRSKIFK